MFQEIRLNWPPCFIIRWTASLPSFWHPWQCCNILLLYIVTDTYTLLQFTYIVTLHCYCYIHCYFTLLFLLYILFFVTYIVTLHILLLYQNVTKCLFTQISWFCITPCIIAARICPILPAARPFCTKTKSRIVISIVITFLGRDDPYTCPSVPTCNINPLNTALRL